MNSAIIIGRAATDIELSYTPQNQTALTKFTLAVDRPKKDGQDQGADFIRIVVWGRQAETTNQYCSKGSKMAVQGRITTGSYKDRDGKTVYTTEVTAERIEFLDNRQRNEHVAQDAVNNVAGFTGVQEPMPWDAV